MQQYFMDTTNFDSGENSKISVQEKKLQKEELDEGMSVNYKVDLHPKVPPIEQLLAATSTTLTYIQQIRNEVKENKSLEKYFSRVGANSLQVISSFQKIEQSLMVMKQSIEKEKANLFIITEIIYFFNKVLESFEMKKKKNIDKAIWILEFETKVSCCFQFIITSLFAPDNITTEPKEKYPEVWARIHSETIEDVKNIEERFKYLKKVLTITTSACINEKKCDWAITKLVSFGLSYPKYFISDKEGQLQSMLFHRKPTVEMAKHIWNLPENGMTMELAKINMKSIKTNLKIYIPVKEGVLPKDICEDDGESIQVRVLHNQSLYLNKDNKRKSVNSSGLGCLCSSPNDHDMNEIDTIILHMHGGGFLALSSRSMQTYTRRWARSLKIPVFSIDYRMPAEHPFPVAPYDCLRVYEFLINHIHKYMNIKPTNVILAGDSAGGNLSFSLMGLILKNNLPRPIGIFTAYPAVDLRLAFSPSKIHAFTDPLLHPPMLLLCLHEYLKGDQTQQENPLASPVLLTEGFISGIVEDKRFPLNWPKTIIQVGAKDPLYDDSILMMERMVSSGIDCKCQVYQNLSHGFLNLDFVVEQCKKTIQDSIIHIKSLMPERQQKLPKMQMPQSAIVQKI